MVSLGSLSLGAMSSCLTVCTLEMYLYALFITNLLELFSYSLDVRYYQVDVFVLLSIVFVLVVVDGLFLPCVLMLLRLCFC